VVSFIGVNFIKFYFYLKIEKEAKAAAYIPMDESRGLTPSKINANPTLNYPD